MGRIKTQLIKRTSLRLFREHRDEVKPSFEENKAVVSGLLTLQSKKLRNVIAGYLTRLIKTKQD